MVRRLRTALYMAMTTSWLIFAIALNIAMVRLATSSLLDFGSFIASGVGLRNGSNPYSRLSPLIFEIHFPSVHTGGRLPNLNPPISLLFFRHLADTNFLASANSWRLLSVVIYAVAILALLEFYKHISILRFVWVFAIAGFWHTIELGQIYTPLLLLAVLVIILSSRNQYFLEGFFLGVLVSIKPNFLVWVLLLIVARHWKAAAIALISFVSISIIPLIMLGPSVYVQWLSATGVDTAILSMPGNSSLIGLTSRFGFPQIGLIFSLTLIGLTATIIVLKPSDNSTRKDQQINELGIILSLLASPIAWNGYMILLLPVFLSRKHWPPLLTIAAAIMTVPFAIILNLYLTPGFAFIFWGWWYGLALTLCLIEVARSVLRESPRISTAWLQTSS